MCANNNVLTIAIPVFNGGEYIRKTLNSIVSQDGYNELPVSIFIADNNSTDNTQDICSDFLKEYNKIKYVKHVENFGYDGNINYLVTNANSDYIWLLGCQDYLVENVLRTLLDFIIEHRQDVYSLNFISYCELNNSFNSNESGITENVFFSNCNDVFSTCPGIGLALSTNIWAKSILTKKYNSVSIHIGWSHVDLLYNYLLFNIKIKTCLVGLQVFILFRERTGWWSTASFFENTLLLNILIRDYYLKSKNIKLLDILNNNKKNKEIYINDAIQKKYHFSFKIISKILYCYDLNFIEGFVLIVNIYYKKIIFYFKIFKKLISKNIGILKNFWLG